MNATFKQFLRIGMPLCALFVSIPSVPGQTASAHAPAPPVARIVTPIVALVHDEIPAADLVEHRDVAAALPYAPDNFRQFSAARAGRPATAERLTLRFSTATRLTRITSTKDFPLEEGGSCVAGKLFARDDTCFVYVRFEPQGPGRRLGKLRIENTASLTPAYIGLGGYGYTPVISFTPSVITTYAPTLKSGAPIVGQPATLTVDGAGTLYIADTGNDVIRVFDSTGREDDDPVLNNVLPYTIAVDSFGDMFIVSLQSEKNNFTIYNPALQTQTSYGTAYSPATCTPSAPCPLATVGLKEGASITIDPYNNLFMDEGTKGAIEMPAGAVSGGNTALDLWYLTDPYTNNGGLGVSAVDPSDNFYTFYDVPEGTPVCDIFSAALAGMESGTPSITKVVGGINCGYSGDGGLAANAEIGDYVGQMAFDQAGNLYFTDVKNQRVRRVDKATGIITTIAGNGTQGYTGDGGPATSATLASPTGLAVDPAGQVYIITFGPSGDMEIVRTVGTQGALALGSVAVGASSAAQTIQLANTGNSPLDFTHTGLSSGNTGDFAVDPNTTSCNFTVALASGRSCYIGFIFKPTAAGSRSAIFSITNDTGTGLNTIQLTGTGATTATLTPTSMTFASTAVGSTSAAQTATLTNTGTGTLTISGTAFSGAQAGSFTKTTTCGASLAAGANCTLSIAFAPGATGTLAATLTVTDNALATTQSISLSGVGAPGTGKAAALTSPTPGSTLAGATVTFTWSAATGATTYALNLGSTGAGSSNLYNSGHITATSATATSLPTNGETIYAELWAYVNNAWVTTNYTYQAAASPTPALTSPARGSVLPGATATFTWTPVAGATVYALNLGSTGVDSANLYNSGHVTTTSVSVKNLPTNGELIYGRLWAFVKNAWVTTDYTFTAAP